MTAAALNHCGILLAMSEEHVSHVSQMHYRCMQIKGSETISCCCCSYLVRLCLGNHVRLAGATSWKCAAGSCTADWVSAQHWKPSCRTSHCRLRYFFHLPKSIMGNTASLSCDCSSYSELACLAGSVTCWVLNTAVGIMDMQCRGFPVVVLPCNIVRT